MEKTETSEIIENYFRIPEGERFQLNGTLYRRQSMYKGEHNCLAVETNKVMHLRPDGRFLLKNGEIVCTKLMRLSEINLESNSLMSIGNALKNSEYGLFYFEDFIQGLNGGTDTERTFKLVAVAVES